MSLAELDAYSEKLATIHKQLMALQTTLEEKQRTCSTLVDSLKKHGAGSLKECSL